MSMRSTHFIQSLRSADSEKLIESTYHKELLKYYPLGNIHTVCNTDGVLETPLSYDSHHILKIIIETKFEESFTSAHVRSIAIGQVLYYLKKFSLIGETLPDIILIGDRDECFVLHSNYLIPYLDKPYNWKIAPSSVKDKNPDLILELTNDIKLQSECFVFDIDDNFSFDEVIEKIENLAQNIKTYVRITPQSISKVFDYFSLRVLKHKADGTNKYTPREQVELFMQLIVSQDDCYPHPKKKDRATFGDKNNIEVYTDAFNAFTQHYQFVYNAKDKRIFTAICDRLIFDSERRYNGDFYTPSVWCDECHRAINKHVGYTWRDNYMVWDCAWGTGNLTRDYNFANLFVSTLEDHDLAIATNYNTTATKFQYDFLNDDIELFSKLIDKVKNNYNLSLADFKSSKLYKKAPSLIKGLLNGEKLLFLINPPYGSSGDMSSSHTGKQKKSGIAKTKLHTLMTNNSVGPCSQQLYAQFIYRIYLFKILFKSHIVLGLFSPVALLTSIHLDSLNKLLQQHLHYHYGMLFQASQFADVKDNWGIAFTLWGSSAINNPPNLEIKSCVENGIIQIGSKQMYAVSHTQKASTWLKERCQSYTEQFKTFTMSNALTPSDGVCGTSSKVWCWAMMDSNIIEKNTQLVTILPRKLKGHISSFPIMSDNIFDIVSLFTARRLITGKYATWINGKDEYMAPNVNHPLYSQWNNDALIYTLFNTGFNMTSLRHIGPTELKTDILNPFFFMSKDSIEQLSLGLDDISTINDFTYNDLEIYGKVEAPIYQILQTLILSPDAQQILDYAINLIKLSFKYRLIFNEENPDYQINNWDASWYQLKPLIKKHLPTEWETFNTMYIDFENRLRPLVYQLGFLPL